MHGIGVGTGAALLLAAMGIPEARANDERPAPPADAQVQDPSLVIGEIVITGRRGDRESAANVLTSVDLLGGDIIERQNVDSAWQLLGRLPGVTLTSFNQGTTSGKFSFRGFNGEGEINAVKLLVDGVPSNSNDGNMPFIDMLFPLDIAAIETVRGTSDPRWGLHSIAGNASVRTRSGVEGVAGRIGYGSHQTLDMQAAGGLRTGAFTQDYMVGYRRSDGSRAHADYDRLALAGKWFYAPAGGDVRIGAIARHYRSDAQEPGYLTQADARADPRQSYAISASDGGKRRIGQYSLHAEAELARGLDASLRGYLNTFDDRRFIRFSAGASQQERYTDERQIGATWRVKWRPEVAALYGLTLEAGGDHQAQSNRSLRWNTAERVRTRQTRDQDFDLDVTGAYVQAIVEPTHWLKLVPALRIDWVGGHYTDRLTGQRYAVNDYGAIEQPKINVAAEPLPGLTLYGNWGRSFQIGVGAGSYKIPPRVTDLAASINDGWETGVKYAAGRKLEARLAYWQQSATGEVRRKLNDPTGDYDNLGATRRRGLDFQVTARPLAGLEAWGSIGWQEARITRPDPASPESLGKKIDHVPPFLASAGFAWEPAARWRVSLWGSAQGSYYLEKTNATGRYGDNLQLNLEASHALTDNLEIELQVKNLTNRYAEYVWWDGAQTLHSPMDGRSVFAALAAKF